MRDWPSPPASSVPQMHSSPRRALQCLGHAPTPLHATPLILAVGADFVHLCLELHTHQIIPNARTHVTILSVPHLRRQQLRQSGGGPLCWGAGVCTGLRLELYLAAAQAYRRRYLLLSAVPSLVHFKRAVMCGMVSLQLSQQRTGFCRARTFGRPPVSFQLHCNDYWTSVPHWSGTKIKHRPSAKRSRVPHHVPAAPFPPCAGVLLHHERNCSAKRSR